MQLLIPSHVIVAENGAPQHKLKLSPDPEKKMSARPIRNMLLPGSCTP